MESIVKSGLLITPEKTIWQEPLTTGMLSNPVEVNQKRACFTELDPSELQRHSTIFGRFALEFDVQAIRRLGGIPVFYLPRPSQADVGLESIAASLICRMGEIQLILNRLGDLGELIRRSDDKSQPLGVQNNESGEKQYMQMSLKGAEDLIAFLTHGSQPVSILRNALRGISGFFYPAEDLSHTGLLGYYRQREWRIVANMSKLGEEQTRHLSDDEVTALLELDEQFFGREIEIFGNKHRLVDQCMYFRELERRSFLSYARRVVVPDEAVDKAAQILTGDRLPDVVPLSSFMRLTPRCNGLTALRSLLIIT